MSKYYTPTPITNEKLNKAFEKASMYLDITIRALQGESYEKIGNSYNLSRQRIGQIIKRLALDGKRGDKNTV